MPPEHQPCVVCGYPRRFLGMAEKPGKDGRIARWPKYDICPNKNDPKLHPAKGRRDERNYGWLTDESIRTSVQDAVRHLDLPSGVLYQVNDIFDPLNEAGPCLEHYFAKYSKLPTAVGMNPEEAGDTTEIEWVNTKNKTIDIPVWPLKNVTKGYGYIFLVAEGSNGS